MYQLLFHSVELKTELRCSWIGTPINSWKST